MSNTKIVVVKLKELLLTAVLVFIGILFILFGIAWVSTKKETSSNSPNPTTTPTSALYTPGVYTSSISIGFTCITAK